MVAIHYGYVRRLAVRGAFGLGVIALQACVVETGTASEPTADNPVCVSAWNEVDQAGGVTALRQLLDHDCEAIYSHGWTVGNGNTNPMVCEPAWQNLQSMGLLDAGKTLVAGDCDILCERLAYCE